MISQNSLLPYLICIQRLDIDMVRISAFIYNRNGKLNLLLVYEDDVALAHLSKVRHSGNINREINIAISAVTKTFCILFKSQIHIIKYYKYMCVCVCVCAVYVIKQNINKFLSKNSFLQWEHTYHGDDTVLQAWQRSWEFLLIEPLRRNNMPGKIKDNSFYYLTNLLLFWKLKKNNYQYCRKICYIFSKNQNKINRLKSFFYLYLYLIILFRSLLI